jgi:hypothetical protein
MVDRLLLARVARSTVADWVDRMGEWAASADRQEAIP